MNKALNKIFILHGKIHTALFHKRAFFDEDFFCKLISSLEPFVLHYFLPCCTNSSTLFFNCCMFFLCGYCFWKYLTMLTFVFACRIYQKAIHCPPLSFIELIGFFYSSQILTSYKTQSLFKWTFLLILFQISKNSLCTQ